MKKLLFVVILLWGGGAVAAWYWNDTHTERVDFRTVDVERGNLLATINATGTIEPEEVVDVGVQIAGEVQSFGKDPRDPSRPISYGSLVEQGTVLAHLDDALFKARVNQARADVARADADVEQARVKVDQTRRDLDRKDELRKKGRGMVSAQEYDDAIAAHETAKAALVVSQAAVDVAKAHLEEASVNLGYTTIRSPVKGVILDRRVNIGQTVVASLNAPSLFLIAKDLSRMEIWASVNETDVGAIHVGQDVRFTVGAFPREAFRGRVSQIRLNASMTQSVVTYTVVVGVDNAGGKLLPYLTARLQFEVQEQKGVLRVPNAALRWQPRIEHVAPEARAEVEKARRRLQPAPSGEPAPPAPESAKGSAAARAAVEDAADRPRPTTGPDRGARGTLWVRRGEFVRPVEVEIGLSDGALTEIRGKGMADGMAVVVGLERREGGDETATPFLQWVKDKAKR